MLVELLAVDPLGRCFLSKAKLIVEPDGFDIQLQQGARYADGEPVAETVLFMAEESNRDLLVEQALNTLRYAQREEAVAGE